MWNIQWIKCHKTQGKWISKPNDTNITEHMFKCSRISFLSILHQIHFSLFVSFDLVLCLYCNSGKTMQRRFASICACTATQRICTKRWRYVSHRARSTKHRDYHFNIENNHIHIKYFTQIQLSSQTKWHILIAYGKRQDQRCSNVPL